jgi:hypothetical protein
MDFSFFTTDNKSGHKTKEVWFAKNYSQEYTGITSYCQQHLKSESSFKEKIWFYFKNLTQKPKCQSCNTEVKFSERFDRGYNQFCSLECANNSGLLINKIKESNLKKHGVEFYTQHKDFIKKRDKTKIESYGDKNYNNTEKMLQTKLKLYGSKKYNNFEKYKETCNIKYGVDNFAKSDSYKNLLSNKVIERYPELEIQKITTDLSMLDIKCNKCDDVYSITQNLLRERKKHNYVLCTKCNPIGMSFSSSHEDSLCSILDDWGVEYERHNRIPNSSLEIDIYIPSIKTAIEFDGIYWHNELYVANDYHLVKTNLCKKSNIDLIHIFEDEWLFKQEIVLSILKNKLKLISTKIYSRNCEIKKVTPNESKLFLSENHIQGNVSSTVKLGLYYKDELVSLMTFGKRNGIGNNIDWELIRFCNKKNTIVVGAASRLFSFFTKNFRVKKIISYSDNRWFNGGVYTKLGFENCGSTKPNYWYIHNGIRYHRLNFKKSELIKQGFDAKQTEKEIMFNRKIYRIYDCGHIRWQFPNH